MNIPSPKSRSPFLSIASLVLGLMSLPVLGLSILFYNAMLADAISITIMIAILLGICTGAINFLGIIFGGLGIFLSRRTMSIIGLALNLAALIGTILVLA